MSGTPASTGTADQRAPLRSALRPDRQPLGLLVLLSLFGHVLLGAAIIQASYLTARNRKPIIDPARAMEVSMVVLPKSRSSMPERASRAAVARGAPEAVAEPDARQPDRVSDLKVYSPEAEETRGAPDRSAERQALMKQLLMQQLLDGLEDAPEGAVDRQASDPDSDSEVGYGSGTSSGVLVDPELARYVARVQGLFRRDFRPLPTIVSANPDISAIVHVGFDLDTGRVTGSEIVESSGNASYDAAAERAVQAVREVPLPPERFRDDFRGGLDIRFTPD